MPDLATASPGERLAWRPAGKELYTGVLDKSRHPGDALEVAEIPVKGQATKMVLVRFSRLAVAIDTDHHAISSLLKPQAEPAGTAK
jgi:hypothetical protein